jgi:hypothetical protein
MGLHLHQSRQLETTDYNMLPPEPKAFHADQPDQPDQTLYDWVWQSPSPTLELAQSPLFKLSTRFLSLEERTRLTYERAKKICDAYSTALIFLSLSREPAKQD